MVRPLLTVYGTCQAAVLHRLLAERYANRFRFLYVPVHLLIAGRGAVPDAVYDSDVFVYQPVRNKDGSADKAAYETAPLVQTLKARNGAVCVSFPFLHFEGYHPDHCYDPLNASTESPAAPDGLFPYGSASVRDLRGTMSVWDIVERTRADDFLPFDRIAANAIGSLDRLRENEQGCDATAAAWVFAKFRSELLFHTVNHPANRLLEHVFDQVFARLGLPPLPLADHPEYLGGHRPPIYPCVRKAFGYPFDPPPVINQQVVSYDHYVSRYASLGAVRGATANPYRAKLTCLDGPIRLRPGERTAVAVRVRNDGGLTWFEPGLREPQVRVSYHLHDADRDGVERWERPRAVIPHRLAPGESALFEVPVEAPDRPGNYYLDWDLVVEGVTWFSEEGCTFPRQPVLVTAAPPLPTPQDLARRPE